MRKKGFTLIELLAVIVILAIIAIISVPIITDLINKSRYGAFGVTKKNIEHAAELYYAKNADDVYWEDNIAYVTIGTLKSKKFLRNNVVNTLDSTSINDDTKVLLYRKGRKIDYSLQLYDKQFFDWYQGQMVQASKKEDISLPTTVGEKVTIDLDVLMSKGLVDELRLPLELGNRCVGYVEVEKTSDNYEYNAYVDCLQGASTFASHYVSYGGKYIDEFNDVKETSDGGYIAVGRSNSTIITKYGIGNNGNYDGIIVKFDHQGNVEWGRNFGGSNSEQFNSVVETNDGYVTVGYTSSDDGDIENYRGGQSDALIVKYSKTGNVLYKKSYGTAGSGSEIFTSLVNDNNKLIATGNILINYTGDLENFLNPKGYKSRAAVNVVFDEQLNVVNTSYFGGTSEENFLDVLIDSNGNYINVGRFASNNIDVTEFDCPGEGLKNQCGIIVKYDSEFNVLGKMSFNGSDINGFEQVIEVSDGYIAVGSARASDLDMEGLSKASNGYYDAIIVKYDKNLENILWKKSFGGTEDDIFTSIVAANSTEVIVVGYSKSSDMDMSGIALSNDGYKNSILVKYNINNGSLISKKVFGGNNSDSFYSIIKDTEDTYIIAGGTFSNDINLKNFNKGHSDAILVSYDLNLNFSKNFQEPVVLIDKLKTINPTYGTKVNLKYDNIYTSNDPTNDLGNWCSLDEPYLDANSSNYYYTHCLKSFNDDDSKVLVDLEVSRGLKIHAGEYEYVLSKLSEKSTNWHQLMFNCSGYTSGLEYSNLKLKFKDGYIGSINSAIAAGYIEPLVSVTSWSRYNIASYLFPNVMGIIEEGGSTGQSSSTSRLIINVKIKKSALASVYVTTNKDSLGYDGFWVQELRNFDMSITPTE